MGTAWELDVELSAVPPSHTEQGFSSWYALDADGTPGNDLALRLHPNGLCVITLAPSHAAFAAASDGKSPSAAAVQQSTEHPHMQLDAQGDAEPHNNGAAAPAPGQQQQQQQQQQATASGGGAAVPAQLSVNAKLVNADFRKGRGPLLQPESILGRLAAGGTTYVLRAGIRGLLVEVNAGLEEPQGPELLRALCDGYVAILEPRAAEAAQLASRCLSEQQYREWRQQRQQQVRQERHEQAHSQPGEQQGREQPVEQQQQEQPPALEQLQAAAAVSGECPAADGFGGDSGS